jgi:hypothetical protein
LKHRISLFPGEYESTRRSNEIGSNWYLENIELDADVFIGVRIPHLSILLTVGHQREDNILQKRMKNGKIWPYRSGLAKPRV